MQFLKYDFYLNQGDVVEICLDKQANVLLMDDQNFHYYQRGQSYQYRGGLAKKSPIRLIAPRTGHWNLAIDLGGSAGTIRNSVRTIKWG